MSISLNNQSKASIEKRLDLKFGEIVSMSAEKIDEVVETRIGKRLKIALVNNERLIGRGSVYLYLKRFIKLDHNKLDKYIDNIKVI
jgi:seryl-tRNA(Sec) selenium transferase